MTAEQKIIAALHSLLNNDVAMTAETNIRDDLGLDSAELIELTVLVHTMYGVDLGRKSAEKKLTPLTVGDLTSLVES